MLELLARERLDKALTLALTLALILSITLALTLARVLTVICFSKALSERGYSTMKVSP